MASVNFKYTWILIVGNNEFCKIIHLLVNNQECSGTDSGLLLTPRANFSFN